MAGTLHRSVMMLSILWDTKPINCWHLCMWVWLHVLKLYVSVCPFSTWLIAVWVHVLGHHAVVKHPREKLASLFTLHDVYVRVKPGALRTCPKCHFRFLEGERQSYETKWDILLFTEWLFPKKTPKNIFHVKHAFFLQFYHGTVVWNGPGMGLHL